MHNLTNYAILIIDGQEVLKWEPLGHFQTYKTKTTCGLRFQRSFFYTKTRATRSSIKEAISKEASLRIPFPNETVCLIWSTDLQLQSELANKHGILSARVTTTGNPETSYTNFIKFVEKVLKGSEWYQINQKTTPPLS